MKRTGRLGRQRWWLWAAVMAVFAINTTKLLADDEERMPAARFATFVARLLTYDNNLKTRAGKKVVLAVLFAPGAPASSAEGTEMASAIQTLELTRILDRPVKTLSLAVTDANALEKSVRTQGIVAFIVSRGLEKQQALIKSVSIKAKVITIGTASSQARAGLSVAVYLKNGKSKILVNVSESKAEGAAFSGDLMRWLEVIP